MIGMILSAREICIDHVLNMNQGKSLQAIVYELEELGAAVASMRKASADDAEQR